MLATLLALGAALGWGASDFVGGLKSRTVPLATVLLVSQATSLTLLAVVAVVRGEPLPQTGALGHAAIAGLAETVGIAALYRGLAVGTMSIVAPAAATAPLVPLLFGLVVGEVPRPVQFAGLGLALLGLVVTSYRSGDQRQSKPRASIGYGLLAALGFGTFFVTMGTASESDVGWAVLTARLTAIVAIGLVVVATRQRLSTPIGELPLLAAIGVLIVAADSFYALATTQGLVSIAAVLSSLHTIVTMALARFILRERLQRIQLAGITITLLGVLAISTG